MARRILQLTSNDEPGGVRTLTSTIAAGLGGAGFEVVTFSLVTAGSPLAKLRHLAGLARLIVTARYDAILCYQPAAAIFGCGLGFMARTQLRIVHQTALPAAVRPLWRGLDRLYGMFGLFTSIIVNSDATRAAFDQYPASYRQRLVSIPHGVEPHEAKGSVNWRQSCGIMPGELMLLATGRLTDQKDHAAAVRALAHVPNAHLVIAGEGPLRDGLVSLAHSLDVDLRLHLVGTVAYDDLGDLLAAADVYLFPSIWETFGIAGVEAAMLGVPVVASDLPVLREVLGGFEPDLTRFHTAGDARQLATAIETLCRAAPSASARARFAASARARHGIGTMIARYIALLSASTAGDGTGRPEGSGSQRNRRRPARPRPSQLSTRD